MATTPIQSLPYPLPGDPADGPAQIKALAEAVEDRTIMRFASTAARDAAIPAGRRVPGMHAYIQAENAVYVWDGGTWLRAFRPDAAAVLSTTPFHIAVARSDRTVTITARQVGSGLLSGNDVPLLDAGVVPAEYRPAAEDGFGAGQGDQPSVARLPVALRVGVDGSLTLIKPAAVTQYIRASATYLTS